MNIAIIGAGAAGLSAAYDLAGLGQQSHRVRGRTTNRRPGGRFQRTALGLDDGEVLPSLVPIRQRCAGPHRRDWRARQGAVSAALHRHLLSGPVLPVRSHVQQHTAIPAAALSPGRCRALRAGRCAAQVQFQLESFGTSEGGSMAAGTLWASAFTISCGKPLLVGKFSEHYAEVNMAWMWARIHSRTTRLGTFVGGFQAFFDTLAAAVRQRGATIHLGTAVREIVPRTAAASPCTRRRARSITMSCSRRLRRV